MLWITCTLPSIYWSCIWELPEPFAMPRQKIAPDRRTNRGIYEINQQVHTVCPVCSTPTSNVKNG